MERAVAPVASEVAQAFAEQSHRALQTGDVSRFAEALAEDAELIADGGGKVYAALNPIRGRGRIVRFLGGLAAKFGMPKLVFSVGFNAGEGFLIVEADGGLQAWSIERDKTGRVRRIYLVRNPDKLAHLHELAREAR
jgi:RNA polymerase sigma-70 factor (ECF subfamily)